VVGSLIKLNSGGRVLILKLNSSEEMSSVVTGRGKGKGKGELYSLSLDSVRRLNLFHVQFPTDQSGNLNSNNQFNEKGQNYQELCRKFLKHNPNRKGQFNRYATTPTTIYYRH
jgi:hypothetical protein